MLAQSLTLQHHLASFCQCSRCAMPALQCWLCGQCQQTLHLLCNILDSDILHYSNAAVWHLYSCLVSPSLLPAKSPPPGLSLQWVAEMQISETQGAAATGVGMLGSPLESMTTGAAGRCHLQEEGLLPSGIPGTTGKEGPCLPHVAEGTLSCCQNLAVP